ncbi:hypothetical protein [Archangium sp.]|uniref:hypothetical protein n=1 Tax=Archangium sp. TaxID=1872627 RepID=UPI00286D28B6|nr:hypothetical protein [Archangium sp.]
MTRMSSPLVMTEPTLRAKLATAPTLLAMAWATPRLKPANRLAALLTAPRMLPPRIESTTPLAALKMPAVLVHPQEEE